MQPSVNAVEAIGSDDLHIGSLYETAGQVFYSAGFSVPSLIAADCLKVEVLLKCFQDFIKL